MAAKDVLERMEDSDLEKLWRDLGIQLEECLDDSGEQYALSFWDNACDLIARRKTIRQLIRNREADNQSYRDLAASGGIVDAP